MFSALAAPAAEPGITVLATPFLGTFWGVQSAVY